MKEFKDYFSKSEIVLWSSSVMVIIISFCVFGTSNIPISVVNGYYRSRCVYHNIFQKSKL